MRNRIGRKVQLKPSHAKWHLDHPEIYDSADGFSEDDYEEETLLHLVCCLGEPVYGKIVAESRYFQNFTWRVKFRVGNLTAEYYVELNHVTLL